MPEIKCQKNLILYGSGTKKVKITVVETGSAAAHKECLMNNYHNMNVAFFSRQLTYPEQSYDSSSVSNVT